MQLVAAQIQGERTPPLGQLRCNVMLLPLPFSIVQERRTMLMLMLPSFSSSLQPLKIYPRAELLFNQTGMISTSILK